MRARISTIGLNMGCVVTSFTRSPLIQTCRPSRMESRYCSPVLIIYCASVRWECRSEMRSCRGLERKRLKGQELAVVALAVKQGHLRHRRAGDGHYFAEKHRVRANKLLRDHTAFKRSHRAVDKRHTQRAGRIRAAGKVEGLGRCRAAGERIRYTALRHVQQVHREHAIF